MSEEKKAAPKKKTKPLNHGVVRRVIDIITGEEMTGIVAIDPVDRLAFAERKLNVGDAVAFEMKTPRNILQWRKAHVLGRYCIEHIEGFDNLVSHQAIKRLQQEGDIECDHNVFDLGTMGTFIHKVPRSLSFESMSQDVFENVFLRICTYLGKTYMGNLDGETAYEMIRMMPPIRP